MTKLKVEPFVTLLFIIFIGITLPEKAKAALTCQDAEVRSIKRPFFPEKPDSPLFDYYFRWIPARPGKPTVVILPGGPGGTSMRLDWIRPDGFGVIQTDPRGVGCNRHVFQSNPNLPDEFYSTSNLALDALAAVASAQVEHYILYGSSYGTMVATIAAGLTEKSVTPKPDAVVLTGVIGESFSPGTVFQGFNDIWSQVKNANRVPQAVLQAMTGESPLGFSASAWGRLIETLLVLGKNPQFDYLNLLSGVLPNSKAELRKQLMRLLSLLENIDVPIETNYLYRAIACHEISGSLFSAALDVDFSYEHGELIPVPHDLCKGIEVDRPFKSLEWKTSAPIYYFEGEMDPSTPMNQALVHLRGQTRSERTFIRVSEGGHSVLELGLADCQVGIFQAIADGGGRLEQVLAGCALTSRLLRIAPGDSVNPSLAQKYLTCKLLR